MKKITATVIAERTLTCAEDAQQEVVVRLAKPELNPGGAAYECAYRIVGVGIDITGLPLD